MSANQNLYQPDYQQPQQQQYSYDPYNIQYNSQMSVQQWNTVPVDQTEYSAYWDSPQAFEPQTFANNTKVEKHYNDCCYAVLFLINLAATIGLFAFLIWKSGNDPETSTDPNTNPAVALSDLEDPENVTGAVLGKGLWIAVALSIGLNILHYIYIMTAPVFYVKFGIWVTLILSVAAAIYGFFIVKSPLFFIFPALQLIFALIWFCICRKYIAISAAILKTSLRIITSHCTIIFFSLLWSFFGCVISVWYSSLVYFNEKAGFSNWIYIYIVFSYAWTSMLLTYVMYMTGAGLAASWYFLNDTEFFPSSPVWDSFKRAMTTSFGSACAASLYLAIVTALKAIVNMGSSNDSGVIMVLRCIAMCILCIIEAFIKFMNRYALIYCAVFGVPYGEGCRRWCELSCKKFCNVLVSGNVIGDCLAANLFCFVIAGGCLGYGIGYLFDRHGLYTKLFACVFSVLFTVVLFLLMTEHVQVIADTLLICYSENPENLKTSAYELEQELESCYADCLGEKQAK